jgi:hypothetical protein
VDGVELASSEADATRGTQLVLSVNWSRVSLDVAQRERPVPGKGIRTPMLVSGPGAQRFAKLLKPCDGSRTVLEGPVGLAASRKLARSVFYTRSGHG